MQTWARVENNNVLEVIDFKPKGKYPVDIEKQFVQCPEYVKSGYVYINNEWYENSCYQLKNNENSELSYIERELKEIKDMIKENNEKLEETLSTVNTWASTFFIKEYKME